MSDWDALRSEQKGEIAPVPTCSTCGAKSVLDPCRSCAGTEPLALVQPAPAELFDDENNPGPADLAIPLLRAKEHAVKALRDRAWEA